MLSRSSVDSVISSMLPDGLGRRHAAAQQRTRRGPQYDAIHLGEELLAARALAVRLQRSGSECHLRIA